MPTSTSRGAIPGGPRFRHRLLLAEDDADLRWSLTSSLARSGFSVCSVRDGAELLDRIALSMIDEPVEEPPHVIVTDIRMPAFNGLSLMEGLRAHGCDIPIIVVSAFSDDEIRERVEELGRSAFLAKPLDWAALDRALQQALH